MDLPIDAYWSVFTLLVSFQATFTFFTMNTNSTKSANITYYPHHECPSAVLLCVLMKGQVNLPSTICIKKALK